MNRSPQLDPFASVQLAFFGGPVARRSDPEPSVVAGRGGLGRSALRDAVLRVHRLHPGGLTDDELRALLPDHHPGSVAKRRHDLVVMGYLVETSITRPSRWGVPSIVWRVAP